MPPAADVARLMVILKTLTLHQQGGRRSLHKPLTVLWAIGSLTRRRPRLTRWPAFQEQVGPLLAEFGLPQSKATPQYPFWRLGSAAELWETHGLVKEPTAADVAATAGFTAWAADLLIDPVVRAEAVHVLRTEYFEDDIDGLLERVGIAPSPVTGWDARDILDALVGTTIETISRKRSNVVSALNQNDVVVETNRTPEGTRIPISVVQNGLDRLWAENSVVVSVKELGHRSSFIGAVLAQLPGVKVTTDPVPRVTLAERPRVFAPVDKAMVATDVVREVKVRTEQDRLRSLLLDGQKTGSCALCGHVLPDEFLIAAHIKRRSVCSEAERNDLLNVAMLACLFGCDRLYEQGYITVDGDGVIHTVTDPGVSARLSEELDRVRGRTCAAHHVLSERYFAWHRSSRFLDAGFRD